MFKSISWQEFLIAVSIAAVFYYAAIIIIFYSRDIAARRKGGRISARPVREPQSSRPAKDLMGPIAAATPIKTKPVAQSSASAEEVEVHDNSTAAPADELLQELRNLFEIMKEGKPSQESYVKNIRTLLSQYTHLIGSEEHNRISHTITDELRTRHDVFLSTDVVDEFWRRESGINNNHSNK